MNGNIIYINQDSGFCNDHNSMERSTPIAEVSVVCRGIGGVEMNGSVTLVGTVFLYGGEHPIKTICIERHLWAQRWEHKIKGFHNSWPRASPCLCTPLIIHT